MAFMKEFLLDVCEKYHKGMTCAQIAEGYPKCITKKYISEIIEHWYKIMMLSE